MQRNHCGLFPVMNKSTKILEPERYVFIHFMMFWISRRLFKKSENAIRCKNDFCVKWPPNHYLIHMLRPDFPFLPWSTGANGVRLVACYVCFVTLLVSLCMLNLLNSLLSKYEALRTLVQHSIANTYGISNNLIVLWLCRVVMTVAVLYDCVE